MVILIGQNFIKRASQEEPNKPGLHARERRPRQAHMQHQPDAGVLGVDIHSASGSPEALNQRQIFRRSLCHQGTAIQRRVAGVRFTQRSFNWLLWMTQQKKNKTSQQRFTEKVPFRVTFSAFFSEGVPSLNNGRPLSHRIEQPCSEIKTSR